MITSLNESSSFNYSLCGPNDNPSRQNEFTKPDESVVNRLCFIYACLSLAGILILVIFLDNIKPQNAEGIPVFWLIFFPINLSINIYLYLCSFLQDTLIETIKKSMSIFSYLKTWLLIPFLAFISFTSTFFVVDFSKVQNSKIEF